MDLKQLQALGAFQARTLFKKEVPIKRPILKPEAEWANPEEEEETGETIEETLTVHVRKRSSSDFLEMVSAENRERSDIAMIRCICNEDGTELFESIEQVRTLKVWLYFPLLTAINEVNHFTPKALPSRTSSGAKSPSLSAGARLRNGKRRSAKKKG